MLPVLPEVTAFLGSPSQPARLLPSLEESQGALYEIGVSDDGYFVGLTEDELSESLMNLKAMAASLGCVVEVLKKVIVGSCEWVKTEPDADSELLSEKHFSADLLVAEALVRPDTRLKDPDLNSLALRQLPFEAENLAPFQKQEENESTIEQLRLSLIGPSAFGKSSLLGTLTSSLLDNGRGKSRLSLLKHRHEISSGITSSVAQDIVGYSPAYSRSKSTKESSEAKVLNYATGDVVSWNDIHNLVPPNGRLVFVSDSPGLSRFSKSTIRTLVSWDPHWVVLCVAADEDDEAPSKAYLDLCRSLEVPLIIAITKVDRANKQGLKQTLARLLSTLKATGFKPVILSGGADINSSGTMSSSDLQTISAEDASQAHAPLSDTYSRNVKVVPIILTSAVSGLGISRLHALIWELPLPRMPAAASGNLLFYIDEVYTMPASKVYSGASTTTPTGTILCGHLAMGSISIGDSLLLGPFDIDSVGLGSKIQQYWPCTIVSLRNLRLAVQTLLPGQVGTIGVELSASATMSKPRKGMILTSNSHPPPRAYAGFAAIFPSTIFSSPDSPPLILGGHALAYFHCVRTAVKVTSVSFMDSNTLLFPTRSAERNGTEDGGIFTFDDEQRQGETVKISFEFLSGLEWFQIGQRVLIMSNATMASEADVGVGAGARGLFGFVGSMCESD